MIGSIDVIEAHAELLGQPLQETLAHSAADLDNQKKQGHQDHPNDTHDRDDDSGVAGNQRGPSGPP